MAVLNNVKLGSGFLNAFPQAMDVYLPSNATRAVVFLHGGGGSKEGAAVKEIGVALAPPSGTTPVPDTQWLEDNHTAFVFPQGQHVQGAQRAATWSNYVMSSGVDDMAFLTALAGALRSGALAKGVPTFAHVYLAGHSNGGMMTNRVWCEGSALFDAYVSLAGPASVQLDPASAPLDAGVTDGLIGHAPCAPASPRPYLGVLGDADTILETKGHWNDDVWTINGCLTKDKHGSWVDPRLVSERRFHAVRVAARCGGAPAAPVTSPDGRTTTWSDCKGSIRLEEVTGANHCVMEDVVPCIDGTLAGAECTNSIEAQSGTRMRDVLVSFVASTE